MIVRMLDNVTAESYQVEGYPAGFEWKMDTEYDLPKQLAWWLIDNGDACQPIVEPAQALYEALKPAGNDNAK